MYCYFPFCSALLCSDLLTEYVFVIHRHNLGDARGANALPIFFVPKNNFLAIEWRRGK